MYAKIQITGQTIVETGMHVGGSSAYAAIGAVDSPIIKDVLTNLPMIPGSSLKGKIRTLLARELNETVAETADDDNIELVRLFGGSKKRKLRDTDTKEVIPRSRVQIADMILANKDEILKKADGITEVKFENTINRITGEANPRQIERAIRDSKFNLDIIYEVDEESELLKDMENLAEGFKLLQYDYLGGNGSRGYGKVRFKDLKATVVVGKLSDNSLLDEVNKILKENSAIK